MLPCLTTGVRPSARATAITDFTRAGMALELNSGASTKSGEIRVRTRKKAATSCSENRASSSLAFMGGSGPDVRGDLRPQIRGPADDRAEHPRAGDGDHGHQRDDLRDERERLLLDLRDGLEDRVQQADHETGD